MIYNYTKCESVIAKIMADLDMSEKNIRITDIREWIFEAVDKIGAPMQYIHRESGVDGIPVLAIEDHQVPLPAGLEVLDGAAYSLSPKGPWIPMRSNTATFKGGPEHQFNPCCECERHCEEECHQPMCYKLPTVQAQFYTANGMKYVDKALMMGLGDEPTYFIKPGWLVTNKAEGYIKLAYETIATDERGYPLIPDKTSYQEAIYWYVVMKLNFPKFLNGKLGGKGVNTAANTYSYLQHQWNFYRNQAYAECMMPTQDEMESIRNDWNKLLPEYDSRATFFRNQGDRQTIINDYYYGY